MSSSIALSILRERRAALPWLAMSLVLAGCGLGNDYPEDKTHLVGWWKFAEGVGQRVADASGNYNVATMTNGGWAKASDALQMDGGNDGIVVVPLTDSLRRTADEITVMAWTYRSAEHNVAVVSHGYPELFFGFHGPQFKWQIVHANGRWTSCYADRKYVASLDRWIHMAATYNGWVARLYADGVEVCSKWSWGPIAMPETPFTMSGHLGESGQIVDEITGRIANVRIYDRALSAEQIRAIATIDAPLE
jgi:concanavalin A-like lectin/glucanase superfamily protein